MLESIIVIALVIFIVVYRLKSGEESVYKFIINTSTDVYDRYAPFSFKSIREKVKEMGQEYSAKQYMTQIAIFATAAFGISYLYFYNIGISIVYSIIAVAVIPYLTYLRCKRIY